MRNTICYSIFRFFQWAFLSFILICAHGCDNFDNVDPKLKDIGDKLSKPAITASEAISLLDTLSSIDYNGLTEGERHYKDFLYIKGTDKGYLKHTSDSLFLTVEKYFASNHSKEMFAEVLYYGGRVYSDLGNYPLALQYFEASLDHIGNPADMELKRRILSQTARLLYNIKLYDAALPYIEECLQLGNLSEDTLIQVYNLELAGKTTSNLKLYKKAQEYYEEGCRLSKYKYPNEYAFNRFEIGNLEYKQGKLEKAIPIIREAMNNVDSVRQNYVLPVAAQVYLKAGITDTAFFISKSLINNRDELNKQIGYYVLLSDEIRPMTSLDSLAIYERRYHELIENLRNTNMENATIIQNSFYNYTIHDRERRKAEKSRDTLIKWIIFAGILSAVITISVLIYFLRKQIHTTRLYSIVTKITALKNLTLSSDKATDYPELLIVEGKPLKTKLQISKEQLKEQLMSTIESKDNEKYTAFVRNFRESSIYEKLIERIGEVRSIENDGKIWNELYIFFSQSCPEFLPNLQLLTDGKLTEKDQQTAMLIKCGFKIGEIAKLLAKAKGTMVSRRDSISLKIFGEKKGSQYIDALIKRL